MSYFSCDIYNLWKNILILLHRSLVFSVPLQRCNWNCFFRNHLNFFLARHRSQIIITDYHSRFCYTYFISPIGAYVYRYSLHTLNELSPLQHTRADRLRRLFLCCPPNLNKKNKHFVQLFFKCDVCFFFS